MTTIQIDVMVVSNPSLPQGISVTYYEGGSQVGSSFVDQQNFGQGYNLSFFLRNSPGFAFGGIGMYVGVPGFVEPELFLSAVGGSSGSLKYYSPNLTIPSNSYLLYPNLGLPASFGSINNMVVRDTTEYVGTPSFMFQFVDISGNTYDADPSVPTDPT